MSSIRVAPRSVNLIDTDNSAEILVSSKPPRLTPAHNSEHKPRLRNASKHDPSPSCPNKVSIKLTDFER